MLTNGDQPCFECKKQPLPTECTAEKNKTYIIQTECTHTDLVTARDRDVVAVENKRKNENFAVDFDFPI